MLQNIKKRLLKIKIVRLLLIWSKKYSFVGFDGASIYFVARFFFISIFEGDLSNRAASIAFNFFIAIFPGIIFIFSLIPMIPIESFQETLLFNIQQTLPKGVKEIGLETISDLINTPRGGVLSVNFFLATYFATNGIYCLTDQFNNTYLFKEKRNFLHQRLIAFILVFISTILLIIAILLTIISSEIINYALEMEYIQDGFAIKLFQIGKFTVAFLLFYFVIAFIYYYGPSVKIRWKFFSAGTSLATVSLILTSIAFGYYVSNLSNYNKIYGSLGTIMVVMLWLFINSLILLIGFELNASIAKAHKEGRCIKGITKK